MGFGFSPLSLFCWLLKLGETVLGFNSSQSLASMLSLSQSQRTRHPKSGRLVSTTLWYRFRTLSMTDERLYDYSKGLNAPYWIQEIKTKGNSPLVLCDTNATILFHCLYLRFVAMLLFGGFILVPLAKLTHSISLLLYWYLPINC